MAETRLHELDQHVASRVRRAREMSGISLERAGEVIGKSVQQTSRLERGENRLSPGELYLFGRAYGVPMSFFFTGLEESPAEKLRLKTALGGELAGEPNEQEGEEALLLMLWRQLSSELRRSLLDLVQNIAKAGKTSRR